MYNQSIKKTICIPSYFNLSKNYSAFEEPWEALADILGDSGREKSTEVVSDAWWYYGLSYFIFPAFFWWDQPC